MSKFHFVVHELSVIFLISVKQLERLSCSAQTVSSLLSDALTKWKDKMRAAVLSLLFAPAVAVGLRKPAVNSTAIVTATDMDISPHNFVEVNLGPFQSSEAACDYCFGSFTKKGDAPAGPVAPFCVCMAYSESGGWNMFCSTPPTAAGYVGKKGGCRCKARDMAAQGKTTCTPIS